MQSGSWFEVQAKGLDSSQRDVLGLLALYGEANISTLTELANALGLRATPTRQLSTTTLPLAARERALATLGRLAHLVPVQTSERTAAKPVPADARLWLRVVPRSGGLSVAAFVRPLGAAGPELVPGVGAAHLLGHLGGEAVQTERELASERAALSELLVECPLLEGLGVAGDSVVLEDAASCLELLSPVQRRSARSSSNGRREPR